MFSDDISRALGLLVEVLAGVCAVQLGAVLVWEGHVGCNLTPGNFVGNCAESPCWGMPQQGDPNRHSMEPQI
jgi:hypothetical protein